MDRSNYPDSDFDAICTAFLDYLFEEFLFAIGIMVYNSFLFFDEEGGYIICFPDESAEGE